MDLLIMLYYCRGARLLCRKALHIIMNKVMKEVLMNASVRNRAALAAYTAKALNAGQPWSGEDQPWGQGE